MTHTILHRSDSFDLSWQEALQYFRGRKTVVFISYCSFWESHGFVQQSLARILSLNKVRVLWLDGAYSRSHHPVVASTNSYLRVRGLHHLPGRRFSIISKFSDKYLSGQLNQILRREGKPVVWVQGGTDPSLAKRIPYVDVLSTFDDPYRFEFSSLCSKAKLVLCQNSFTYRRLTQGNPERDKYQLALPPIDLSNDIFNENREFRLPTNFPKKVMGYIGSAFPSDFDFKLLEYFADQLPEWGFLLMGRTNEEGMRQIASLKTRPNFCYLPWVPRSQLANAWRYLSVSLLLYRPQLSQDGAFPVKAVESAYFGIPCVATKVRKTEDLQGSFPRTSLADQLIKEAIEVSNWPSSRVQHIYSKLADKTNPKSQLIRVAKALKLKDI